MFLLIFFVAMTLQINTVANAGETTLVILRDRGFDTRTVQMPKGIEAGCFLNFVATTGMQRRMPDETTASTFRVA